MEIREIMAGWVGVYDMTLQRRVFEIMTAPDDEKSVADFYANWISELGYPVFNFV